MDNVVKLRQGNTFTHIWNNPSLLRKPLTNIYMQDNYTIMGAIMAESHLISLKIQSGYPTAWDGELDVATGPKFGMLAKDAESNW